MPHMKKRHLKRLSRLARKQLRRKALQQLLKQMVLEGVVGIQSGVAPGALRSKLKTYLGSHGGGAADKKH